MFENFYGKKSSTIKEDINGEEIQLDFNCCNDNTDIFVLCSNEFPINNICYYSELKDIEVQKMIKEISNNKHKPILGVYAFNADTDLLTCKIYNVPVYESIGFYSILKIYFAEDGEIVDTKNYVYCSKDNIASVEKISSEIKELVLNEYNQYTDKDKTKLKKL